MKFSSKVKLVVRSGKGGDGIIAWRRESRVRYGGPAGGDGGHGGDVWFIADENLNSLYHLHGKKHFFASPGENGRNKSQHGRKAENLYIPVPCGTNIYDFNTNHKLAELIKDKDEVMICRGGKGGKGNIFFKSSLRPAPFMYERGDWHEEKEIFLELESIADVGFLGFPNAGKSTLLGAISNAKPKVASFPFTTIVPVLGRVEFNGEKAVFADIPGLIEGASDGNGLGFEFLKHLNRCHVLVHLVACNKENLLEDIKSIEEEIKKYSEFLFSKKRILAINKIDQFSEDEIKEIRKKLSGYECFFISAKEKINIDKLLKKVFKVLIPEKAKNQRVEPDYLEFNDENEKEIIFKIKKIDDVWHVEHQILKYWIYKIPRNTNDNLERLKSKLTSLGVNKELKKQGAKKGEKVLIYDYEYQFFL